MEHHAYIYEGRLSLLPELTLDARAFFGFKKDNDPDVQMMSFEKFGIDDSQALRDRASLKSISGRALFVVGLQAITSEAQQALLKLFEEPQKGTIFILLTPHGVLLPTLRSRTMRYPNVVVAEEKVRTEGKKFLSQSQSARSTFITALLKDDEGARERVQALLSELEVEVYVRFRKSNTKELRSGLKDIAKVRSYTNDRSPALKMLLEHLALSLPTI